ncbi:MAG: hypothetical protein ACREIA_15585 [Opitutaceae bacterium]
MTTPPFKHPWEKRLRDELRKLPELEAPPSLVSGVMAIIRAREKIQAAVWWKRPAATWPLAARAALAITSLAAFAGFLFADQLLGPQIAASPEAGWLAQAGAKIGGLWTALVAMANAFLVVVRGVLSPALLAVVAGICFSYIALLGIGGALWRVVINNPRA